MVMVEVFMAAEIGDSEVVEDLELEEDVQLLYPTPHEYFSREESRMTLQLRLPQVRPLFLRERVYGVCWLACVRCGYLLLIVT